MSIRYPVTHQSYTQLRLRISDLHQDTYQIMLLVTVAVRPKLLNTISFTVHPTLKHETISKHFSRIITVTLAVLLNGDPNLLSATKSVILCSWRVAALPWPTRCASSLSPLDPFSSPPPTFDLTPPPPRHPTSPPSLSFENQVLPSIHHVICFVVLSDLIYLFGAPKTNLLLSIGMLSIIKQQHV